MFGFGKKDPLPELLTDDVKRCVLALPVWLKSWMEEDPRIVVAGGFCRAIIRGEEPKDIDVWTPADFIFSDERYRVAAGSPCSHDVRRIPEDNWEASLNSWTRRRGEPVPVSFIIHWRIPEDLCPADALEAVVRHFDFTVCQAAFSHVTGDVWRGVCSPWFYQDLAARRLRLSEHQYNRAQDGASESDPETFTPVATLRRALRYAGYGYNLGTDQLQTLLEAIQQLDEDQIEEQLGLY